MGDSRPLERARRRSAPEVIELSDSEPGNTAGGSASVSRKANVVSKRPEDPIIISSSSDGMSPLHSSAKKPRSKRKSDCPRSPPRDVDVIVLDSDEDTSGLLSKAPIPHMRTLELPRSAESPRSRVQAEKEGLPAPENTRSDLNVPDFYPTYEEDMNLGNPATPPASTEPEPEPIHISSSVSPVRPEASNAPEGVHEEYANPQAAVDAIDRAFGHIDLDVSGGDGVDANVEMDVDPSPPERHVQSPPPAHSSPRTNAAAPQGPDMAPAKVPQTLHSVPAPLPRVPTYVVPDISSLNVRFNRPESSHNTFFSRALGQNTTALATSKIPTSEANASKLPLNTALPEERIPTPLRDPSSSASPNGASSPAPPSENKPSPPRLVESSLGGVPDTPAASIGAVATQVEPNPSKSASPVVGSNIHLPPDLTSTRRSAESTIAPQRPSTMPPRKRLPLGGASLVDTINKIRQDHLQSMDPASGVRKLKSTSPATRDPRPSPPMQSQIPFVSSQAQETSIPPRPPLLDPIRSLLSKRLPHPDSKQSEPMPLAPPSLAMSSSSSSHRMTDTPTTGASTQTTNLSTSSASTRRPLPVPFEGFISHLPATQRSLSSQIPASGKSRKQQSPHRVSGAAFESFIVKVPRKDKEPTKLSEDSAVSRAVPRQMARKRTSKRPRKWTQNISAKETVAFDTRDELINAATETSSSRRTSSPVQHGDDDKMVVDTETKQDGAGVDADRLLDLADIHLKSSVTTSHIEESPDVLMYPEVRYLCLDGRCQQVDVILRCIARGARFRCGDE